MFLVLQKNGPSGHIIFFQSLLMAAVELNNSKRNQSIIENVLGQVQVVSKIFSHFHTLLGFDLIRSDEQIFQMGSSIYLLVRNKVRDRISTAVDCRWLT